MMVDDGQGQTSSGVRMESKETSIADLSQMVQSLSLDLNIALVTIQVYSISLRTV